jgi:hypothetical protein
VYISPINSRQNINSKARLSLLADKNLLPKDAAKQIAEKVKTIGRPDDTIHLCIYRRLNSQKVGETTIIAGFLGLISSDFTDYTKTCCEPQNSDYKAGIIQRNWSILGDINQKSVRPQDKPIPLKELPHQIKDKILMVYPNFEF